MHTHTDIQGGNDPHPPRITIRALVAVFALAALLTTVGCKKKADGDDHGAAKPAAAGHAQGDGHDHGKGGEEVHTDEVKLTADAVERYGIKIEAAQMWALRPTIVTPARVGFNAESDLQRRVGVRSVIASWAAIGRPVAGVGGQTGRRAHCR